MDEEQELLETLLTFDRELAAGDGDTYRERLLDEAMVVVPGARMTTGQTAAAMDDSAGWDRFELDDPELAAPAPDVGIISYTFRGERGSAFSYAALCTTVYVRRVDGWKLALHQQTPLPD